MGEKRRKALGIYIHPVFDNSKFWKEVKHLFLTKVSAWQKWVKVFKNYRSEICGRQPLKNLK